MCIPLDTSPAERAADHSVLITAVRAVRIRFYQLKSDAQKAIRAVRDYHSHGSDAASGSAFAHVTGHMHDTQSIGRARGSASLEPSAAS